MNIERNFSLQKKHSFGIDVNCDFFTSVTTLSQVREIMTDPSFANMPKFWLGGGNNVLFVTDFKGLVIQVQNKGIEVIEESEQEVLVRAQAGEDWEGFIRYAVSNQWWGIENLTAIPGSVGGAPIQNIGAYGVEVKDVIQRVEAIDLRTMQMRNFDNEQCKFGYRESVFKEKKGCFLIWSVVFRLKKQANPQLSYANLAAEVYKEAASEISPEVVSTVVARIRKEKLPEVGVLGSAGSIFKNPFVSSEKYKDLRSKFPNIVSFEYSDGAKIAAAWMIDYCGWKAYREGDAGVYPSQALVLVNYGNASGYDILKLAHKIQKSVFTTFGVEIEMEVNIVGEYQKITELMFSSLPMFHRVGASAYKPNLNNTHKLMEALGYPETKFKSIHVAGTNGKGSTSHLLASVFQEAGFKTGLYTSPHLKDFRERIRINGEMISQKDVVDFYMSHEDLFTEIQSSFFEMTVAMAFDFFAKKQVDIAIIEVGMGGRLDSTNVIYPELSVITNISFDHVQFLGATIEAIAQEKAGIIKAKIPVVVGNTSAESLSVFRAKAREMDSVFYYAPEINRVEEVEVNDRSLVHKVYSKTSDSERINKCQLLGSVYQLKNLEVVYTALEVLTQKFEISEEAIQNGVWKVVENTGIKGRWQVLSENPRVICDTGHNKDGVTNVLKQLARCRYQRLHVVLGFVNDKEVDAILRILPQDALYYYCKADIPRGMEVQDLETKAKAANLVGEAYESVNSALQAAIKNASEDDLVFVGGSTFVVAEIC